MITEDVEKFLWHFKKRRELTKVSFTDQELMDALRLLHTAILAKEVELAFRHKGRAFIWRCIQYLKNGQYKDTAKPRLNTVAKSKLDLFPDK